MKKWLAEMMWGALVMVSKRAFDWATDPLRWQRMRMKHRQIWWDWYTKAQQRNSDWRMRVAACYAIAWKFETTPPTAQRRGDLTNTETPGRLMYNAH